MGPPLPPPGTADNAEGEEPEFEASEDDDDLPEFPTTHELQLKDHTKVVSALTLDPSGARIVSGSHDYDCKLWDFGGMDWRCKPFKTWEPAGTYYVGTLLPFQAPPVDRLRMYPAGPRREILKRWSTVPGHLRYHAGQAL